MFVALYYFPVETPAVNLYKLSGWALAAFTSVLISSGRLSLKIKAGYLAPTAVFLAAGLLGSLSFGSTSALTTAKVVQNLVLLMLLPALIEGLPDIMLVLRAAALGGTLTAVSGFVMRTELTYDRVAGVAGNANGYGQICAQAAIAAIALMLHARRRAVRVILVGPVLACLFGLVLSGSRGAMAGLAAAVLSFLVMRRTRGVAIAFAAAAGAVVVLAMPASLSKRWEATFTLDTTSHAAGIGTRAELARRGVEVYKENPVFGTGFGNARAGMAEIGLDSGHVTHNVFTQVMAETGTFGLAAFLILIVNTGYQFWKLPAVELGSAAGPVSRGVPAPDGWPRSPAPSGAAPAPAVPRSSASHLGGLASGTWQAPRRYRLIRRLAKSTTDPVSAVLVAMLVAVTVGQLASGNYVHAIWYILFGTGQSLQLWQERVRTAARKMARNMLHQ